MVPCILLACGLCDGMFILHNHLCAQIHHSWLLVKTIGKADIMLEVNKYPLMHYWLFVLSLRLLGQTGMQEQVAHMIP